MSKRCSKVHESVQQAILNHLEYLKSNSLIENNCKLLDIGCWNGANTLKYANILDTKNKFGIEIFDQQIKEAQNKNVIVEKINLESDNFPFGENSFDIIVCNQVFEHLKQIFHPMDQIFRILKPRGYFVFLSRTF